MVSRNKKKRRPRTGGKLRIGDHWSAISIIALSQTNPLKAVAEFVENSIDARAKRIMIVRGKKKGEHYLKICDDGEGIPLDADGKPDFKHVATHICDSIKRQLKHDGATGIQGEFGIGLLSFWTVGESLQLACAGWDGKNYVMTMSKGSPDYTVARKRLLMPIEGTELVVHPILPGIRQLSGERMQRFLASELRDRIKMSGVEVRIIDRTRRAQYKVEPRQFSGRLLRGLPASRTTAGEIYLELYLAEPGRDNDVGLYRKGTRVLPRITDLEGFQSGPWTSGYLQGIIDASMLNLTPGTRSGVIRDAVFEEFERAIEALNEPLEAIIEEQRRAEEERASRQILRSVQKALREAMLALPPEEYDWFSIDARARRLANQKREEALLVNETGTIAAREGEDDGDIEREAEELGQKEFFRYAGPLFSAMISPRSSMVQVNKSRAFRALCRDRSRRQVESDLEFRWEIVEGAGRLENEDGEIVTYVAPGEPGLVKLQLRARQGEVTCDAEAVITVTDSILPDGADRVGRNKGLPGYTFKRAPGEDWRSQYDSDKNLIVINNGHRDFVHASRQRMSKLRYICRLFGKELVLHNFPGLSPGQILERMIELTMYTEENLK